MAGQVSETTDPDLYDRTFFEGRRRGARDSADNVVPFVVELTQPTTVVDYGCGTGSWVAAFLTAGVTAVGVDGDYVNTDQLEIPGDAFHRMDLEHPTKIGDFDLAICLEVAEHLTPRAGDELIDVLTQSAPLVLFGAALPGQGGTGHINEQWQSYWAERFAARGFFPTTEVRDRFWASHPDVTYHYSQNTLLYRRGGAAQVAALDVMHPVLAARLTGTIDRLNLLGPSALLRRFPGATVRAIRARTNARR